MLLLTTTFNIYQIQGTLTIVLTFFSFVKPIQYQKFYTERTVKWCVFGGHIVAIILACVEFPERIYKPGLYSMTLMDVHTSIRFGSQMFLFVTMFLFYLMTFYIVVFKKDNVALIQTMGAEKYQKQKKTVIKSVLIYFTPPVFLLIISASGSLCIAQKAMLHIARGWSQGNCGPIIKVTDHLVMQLPRRDCEDVQGYQEKIGVQSDRSCEGNDYDGGFRGKENKGSTRKIAAVRLSWISTHPLASDPKLLSTKFNTLDTTSH
ncbi:hypothetical protein L596_012175 [Steinernema carpocapsae]|uniref:Uncharacterized protein n=1 Tax=Steinernema carpocapsae TaxID=34508 RepID=A0A4U5NWB8_STECR|nr:hypothetical protein L596_012175 [Steinernema carpocapsae]